MIQSTKTHDFIAAIVAGVAVMAVILLGQAATFPNLVPWHQELAKPSFNPPNWLFGPVWTTLYILMAIAAWRLARRVPPSPARMLALTLFLIQLALNVAWSWMFFAAQSPLLGLINIVPQLVVILMTIGAFRPLDKIAAWCLLPLAAWVSFATLLNFSIWQLNP